MNEIADKARGEAALEKARDELELRVRRERRNWPGRTTSSRRIALTTLEPEFEIVSTVANGRALLSECGRLKPDVVILNIAMPLLGGLDEAGPRAR
jgi:AmiR/NasT family two-component response regulator